MLRKRSSKVWSCILLVMAIIMLSLFACDNDENTLKAETLASYNQQIEALTSKVIALQEENSRLIKVIEDSKTNENQVNASPNQSKENFVSKKYASYEDFKKALDQSSKTYQDLIDFYYSDIGDGAYGQDYAGKVLEYFFELPIDDFLVISRKLNDRYIDNFAYNISQYMLNEHSMSDTYMQMRSEIQLILLDKLEDSNITSEDRQLIHALLSHWYRND